VGERSEPIRWVLLVTEGLSMAFPAEVYSDERVAEREAERWAWLLSRGGHTRVERPFAGRWEVGDFWIRLVQAFLHEEGSEIWVGTSWTRHGYPEPEAELFADRSEAKAWAITPPHGGVVSEIHETPWYVSATFKLQGTETDSIVQLAKVVS
jgi:hypothetical protein